MDKPSTVYRNAASSGKKITRQEAALRLQRKYFNTKREYDDLLDVDEQYLVTASKYFIPGKIYTFSYIPSASEKKTEYFDKQPILLSFYNYVRKEDGELVEMGVNINLIPPHYRFVFLDSFWMAAKKLIAINEKYIMDKRNQQVIFPMENMALMNQIFNMMAKIPYQYALQSFVKRCIKPIDRVRIITYDDWHLLPMYVPSKNSFVGKPIQEVWSEYIKKRTDLLNKERSKSAKDKISEKKELSSMLKTRKR